MMKAAREAFKAMLAKPMEKNMGSAKEEKSEAGKCSSCGAKCPHCSK